MKTNKKWLIALTASFAVLTCVSAAMLKGTDSVSANAEALTATDTAAASEFYMNEGASVYAGGVGIRFSATITESWWNSLNLTAGTYTFASTVTANGVSETEEYDVTPTFKDGVYNLYSAVTYDNVSEAQMTTAAALDFSAKTYLKVGNDVIEAYGNAGERSMQAVANTAWLTEKNADGTANQWYHSEALEAYFDEGARTEDVRGGFTSNGAGTVTVPGLTKTDVRVYVGAEEVTATVTGEKVTLSNVDVTGMTVGEEVYVSVFAGNTVYSSKAVYADKVLTASNFSELQTATEGYYALAENIDMSTNGYTIPQYNKDTSVVFTGTFNGCGYTISKVAVSGTQSGGLFSNLSSATVKNLSIVDASVTGAQSGVLAQRVSGTADTTTIENVFISGSLRDSDGYYEGAVVGYIYTRFSLNNVIIKLDNMATTQNGFVSGRTNQSPSITLTNCYFIGGNGLLVGSATTTTVTGTYNVYENAYEYTVALPKIEQSFTTLMKAFSDSYVKENVTWLTKDNFAQLQTATSGIYALAEDIDVTKVAGYSTRNNSTGAKFTGVFDGNGHTISGISVSDNSSGGVFYRLSTGATVKNLAILGASVTGSQSGILAQGVSDGKAYIENVFISGTLKDCSSTDQTWRGAIGCTGSTGIDLKNVIIKLDALSKDGNGFVYGFTGQTVTLENCYFIGGNGQVVGVRSNYTPTVSGTQNVYTDDADFNTAYQNLTLTEELEKWCEDYLGSTPKQSSIE